MSDEHPDADEISRMLDIAADKLKEGFEIVFEISRYDAELLIDTWDDATEGDVVAVGMLLAEVQKLVEVLRGEMGEE
jgi:hypothetical protein